MLLASSEARWRQLMGPGYRMPIKHNSVRFNLQQSRTYSNSGLCWHDTFKCNLSFWGSVRVPCPRRNNNNCHIGSLTALMPPPGVTCIMRSWIMITHPTSSDLIKVHWWRSTWWPSVLLAVCTTEVPTTPLRCVRKPCSSLLIPFYGFELFSM